jgi:hypothetical protein
MDQILSLNYERFLCAHPQINESDAKNLSRFHQQLETELTKKEYLYNYSVNAQKHLQVHIAYKNSEDVSNLIDETTSLLEDIAKKSGFYKGDFFALNSSKVLPLEIYEAEVHKQILSSLLKQVGLCH